MRKILNIKANLIQVVEDQIACDMIASGEAVPSIETMDDDMSGLEFGQVVSSPEPK